MALGMLDVLNASAALRFANGKGLRSENPSMMGCNGNRILGDRRNRRACGRVHLCTDSYETQRGVRRTLNASDTNEHGVDLQARRKTFDDLT